MDKANLINNILIEWASRSPTGLCSEYFEESDLEALYEVVKEALSDTNIDPIEFVNEVSVIAEKGKHPERQAYNQNGILVTFPTPEYKSRAVARGTHFEKNPKAGQTNLFGGGQQTPQAAAPENPSPTTPNPKSGMDAGDSSLPKSDTNQPQAAPDKKEVPEPGTPGGAVATSPSTAGGGSSQPPAQGQLAVEPTQQPSIPATANVAPPAPVQAPPQAKKTPQAITAEKEVIKNMLDTDDTLPTVPGVGGSGMTESLKEQLNKLTKVALEMNLNEAVKYLSNLL